MSGESPKVVSRSAEPWLNLVGDEHAARSPNDLNGFG
jgi:hypothetical protein